MVYSVILKSQLEGALRMDAEYYQLEYLDDVEKIKSFSNGFKAIGSSNLKVVSGPFGSSLKSSAYLESGVPFLRISDLRDFFINKTELVYISEEDNLRLKQSQLFSNDIVLSKVGNTIGILSKVPQEFKVCNISENNIGIKFKDSNFSKEYKDYLLVFFNSKFGFDQIFRRISGNAQPKLNIQDVYNIIYPLASEEFSGQISNLVTESEVLINEGNKFYSQAENLLLEEVGLRDFINNENLFGIVNLSEIKKVNRIDAEYFLSDFTRLVKKIKTEKLGSLVAIKKGIEPGSEAYQDVGKLFMRVSSLTKEGIIDKDQKYLSDGLYQKLKEDFQPNIGEILLTKDATPGIAYALKEPIEGIISGGILRLSIKENVSAEYLAFCINSIIGKSQVDRDAGGSIIKHWRPEQIKSMQIPILPVEIQQKIADLTKKSHEARKKAKELLEEAKNKVEKLIESK